MSVIPGNSYQGNHQHVSKADQDAKWKHDKYDQVMQEKQ